MSLGIAFKGAEGIVLAADSRVTLLAIDQQQKMQIPAAFDNATKLLRIDSQKFVGAVTYGVGALGGKLPRTAHSFMSEFEAELSKKYPPDPNGKVQRLQVEKFAEELGTFFLARWKETMPLTVSPGNEMIFLVGGYDETEPYGKLFEIQIPSKPLPRELLENQFGAAWGGQREFTDRLLNGFDPQLPNLLQTALNLTPEQMSKLEGEVRSKLILAIPYQFLPLQDCVDLSIFLIRTTITLQKWLVGVRGVGGFIDVAVITKTEPFSPIQQKKITGEQVLA